MATRVYVNVDVEPFCAELVFPKGVDVGGFVSLVFGPFVHGSTADPNSKSGRRFALAKGNKKDQPKPVSKKVFIQAPYGERNPLCTLREAPLPDLEDIPDESEDEAVDDPIYEPSREGGGPAAKIVSPMVKRGQNNEGGKKENEGVTCSFCGGWFANHEVMQYHHALSHFKPAAKSQEKKTVYGCSECKQMFSSSADCILHKWKHKPESEWPFQCKTCNRGFTKKHFFLRHQDAHKKKAEKAAEMKIVSPRETFLCVHCEQLFLSQAGLARHLTRYHTKKPVDDPDPETVPEREAQVNSNVVTIHCDHCTFGCNDVQELAEHVMLNHPNVEVFRCQDCSKPYLVKDDLDVHRAVKHVPLSVTPTAEGFYVCHICDRKLQSFSGYWNHLRGHTKARPFLCDHCGHRYCSRGALTKHTRTHHFANAVKCPHCSKEFATLSYLKVHERLVHIRDFNYACKICGHKFPSERKQQMHMAIVHEQELTKEELASMKRVREFCCSHCPFKTYSQFQFRRHVASHTGKYAFPCTQCSRGFTFRYQLTLHMRKSHRPGGPLRCSTCPRNFAAEDVHKAHMELHASPLASSLTCKDCNRLFETPRLLDRHRSAIHLGKARFPCTKCPKIYSVASGLAQHVRRVHKGADYRLQHPGTLQTAPRCSSYPQKPGWKFCCEPCQRFFKYESSLRAHRICYHTEGVGPPREQKTCPECGKVFQSGIHLSLHIRMHTKEQSFKCTLCSKSYRNRSGLKKHIAVTHRSSCRFFCPRCEMGFVSQASHLLHCKFCKKDGPDRPKAQEEQAPTQHELPQILQQAVELGEPQVPVVDSFMDTAAQEMVDDPTYNMDSAQHVLQLLSDVSQVEVVVSESMHPASASLW
ncbi:zinc finger protein 665-like [Ornithodoros turicata]